QVAAVVQQQTVPGAGRGGVRARSGADVVIELEVADAVIADEAVDHLVEERTGGGTAQVQVVTPVLDDPGAGPAQERIVGELDRGGAAHAYDLRFEPQAGHQPPAAD